MVNSLVTCIHTLIIFMEVDFKKGLTTKVTKFKYVGLSLTQYAYKCKLKFSSFNLLLIVNFEFKMSCYSYFKVNVLHNICSKSHFFKELG